MNDAEFLMKNFGIMMQKPNSIIVLLFIQNNSKSENIAKTCLPSSMLSSYTAWPVPHACAQPYHPGSGFSPFIDPTAMPG